MRVKRIFVVHAPHKVGSAPRLKVSEHVGGISEYSGPRGVASFISGEENERPQTSGAFSAMHELIFCSKVLELTVRKFCHIKFAAWNRWCHVRQIVTIYEYSRSCLADVSKAYLDHSAVFRMALGRWTGPRFSRANLNTVRNNCRWLTFQCAYRNAGDKTDRSCYDQIPCCPSYDPFACWPVKNIAHRHRQTHNRRARWNRLNKLCRRAVILANRRSPASTVSRFRSSASETGYDVPAAGDGGLGYRARMNKRQNICQQYRRA